MRFEFLTSTPLSATEGSGTFVAIDGLVRGLGRLGHTVTVRPLATRTGFHTFDRWLYNAGVVLTPPAADVAVGVDLDGFLWARRRRAPFVVMLKGIIADELRNERGLVRALLGVQAANLVAAGSRQLAMLADGRWGDVERALDRVERRFGKDAALPATLLGRNERHGAPRPRGNDPRNDRGAQN